MPGGSWLFWTIVLAAIVITTLTIALLRKRARKQRNRGSGELDVTLDDWGEPTSSTESARHHPVPDDPISRHLKHLGDEPVRDQAPSREQIQPLPRRQDDGDYHEPRRRHINDGLIPVIITDQDHAHRSDPTRHELPDTPTESPTHAPSGGGWGGSHGNDGGSHGGGGGAVSGGGGDTGGGSSPSGGDS